MTEKCEYCGESHGELPMDIAYKRPYHYFLIPEDEVEKRIRINDDLCVIDEEVCLIRGLLSIPVMGCERDFKWGVWAIISKQDFARYMELWEVDYPDIEPFVGMLSCDPPGYEGILNAAVEVHIGESSHRPEFRLKAVDHLMYEEQQTGITLQRVHEILRQAMPHLFSPASTTTDN
jgi:hypothetical protein